MYSRFHRNRSFLRLTRNKKSEPATRSVFQFSGWNSSPWENGGVCARRDSWPGSRFSISNRVQRGLLSAIASNVFEDLPAAFQNQPGKHKRAAHSGANVPGTSSMTGGRL